MKLYLAKGVPTKFVIKITNNKSNIIKKIYCKNFEDCSHTFKKLINEVIQNDDEIYYFDSLESALKSPFPVYYVRKGFYKFGKLVIDEFQFDEPCFNYFEHNNYIYEFNVDN